MSALKNKLKLKSNIKDQIEKEDSKGSSGPDKRFLNYYDLKEGEKMTVLIVPDPNGELWTKFRRHGPNLKTRGVGSIGCRYDMAGEDCPVCQKGFSLLDLEKETGDKAYRTEAKKWFARDYTVMNVVVLDSPIDVLEAEDGNQVKLMYVPFAIENLIKEHLKEGIIEEDELCTIPLNIKMTKNAAGYAAYDSSFFARKPVTDEELEAFDDFKVEPHDLSTLDVIPELPSKEEAEEWVEKAQEKLDAATDKDKSSGGSSKSSKTKESAAERLKKRKVKEEEPEEETQESNEPDYDDDVPMDLDEEQEEKQEEERKPSRGSVRDRLNRLRK